MVTLQSSWLSMVCCFRPLKAQIVLKICSTILQEMEFVLAEINTTKAEILVYNVLDTARDARV